MYLDLPKIDVYTVFKNILLGAWLKDYRLGLVIACWMVHCDIKILWVNCKLKKFENHCSKQKKLRSYDI